MPLVSFLPPIATQEVRSAVQTFATHTAVVSDGWRPRDIGHLSDQAVHALTAILNLAEVAACPLGDLVDVVFLPKPGGG